MKRRILIVPIVCLAPTVPRWNGVWPLRDHALSRFIRNPTTPVQSPQRLFRTPLQTNPHYFPQTLDNHSNRRYNSRHTYTIRKEAPITSHPEA